MSVNVLYMRFPDKTDIILSSLNKVNQIATLLGNRSFVCRSHQWGGQSSIHVQTTLLVFQCCEAIGALKCMFWEILQKLAELYRTEDVLLTTNDGVM